jgi:hypothetical protein
MTRKGVETKTKSRLGRWEHGNNVTNHWLDLDPFFFQEAQRLKKGQSSIDRRGARRQNLIERYLFYGEKANLQSREKNRKAKRVSEGYSTMALIAIYMKHRRSA